MDSCSIFVKDLIVQTTKPSVVTEGQFWVLGKRRDLNCSALVVSSKMHPRFFPLKSSQDMALRYGKWGKSLPFRGDRACLQVTFNHSIAFDHSVAVRQSLLVGCYREHGSINTHKPHLAELLYRVGCFSVGQRWFSILSFVYLCSGFFALVPVPLHLSSEYLKCHAALTSPCNQIHFRTLQKMLTSCPASFAQLTWLRSWSRITCRQFMSNTCAAQVFARPMPAESMAERAREVLLISTKFHSNLIDILHTEIRLIR